MPFSSELLVSATREIKVGSVKSDFEYAEEIIVNALASMAEKNPFIVPENMEIYVHGSYGSNLNIFFPSNLELVVELKKTYEYDPLAISESGYRIRDNYFVELEIGYGPQQFRQELFEAIQEQIGGKCYESEKTIVMLSHKHLKHNVEITPCFSFRYINEDQDISYHGVALFDAGVGANIITFPKLHAFNGHGKDLACDGNYKPIVRMFKTLNMIGEREFDFPLTRGYFIQCLLYNVPNSMFVVNDLLTKDIMEEDKGFGLHQVFLKVINYLTNCNMESFRCQNEVWQLFGNAQEFWNIDDAKEFVRNLKKLYETFPESRTQLA